VVEINLREPSMLHGKKGFDRIVYAFKNALTDSVTWLFCDLAAAGMFYLSASINPSLIYADEVTSPFA
jgi:hypothetical protein